MADKNESKSMGLFDFLDGIYTDQRIDFYDSMSDRDKKGYKNSKYMMHRFLSMNTHYLPIVNEIQKYTQISGRAHYQFLTNIIPRGKQFNKYIKSKKKDKYETWLIELVSKHYEISINEATTYLDIFYKSNKSGLKELCQKYGVDKKQLKKAKL